MPSFLIAVIAFVVMAAAAAWFVSRRRSEVAEPPRGDDPLAVLREMHCDPHDSRWPLLNAQLASSVRSLPFLRDLAERCDATRRWNTLALAATIASGAKEPQRDPELERLTRDCFAAGGIPRGEFPRYLAALAAFCGEQFWAQQVAELVDETVVARCARCGGDAITPEPGALTAGAKVLYDEAVRAGETSYAAAMAALFDEGICAACGRSPIVRS